MRPPTPTTPPCPAPPAHPVCLTAVVGDSGSERAATWLAAALAGIGEPVGLLTEACDDDGDRCVPRPLPRTQDAAQWLERCGLGGVRVAVAQATPVTPIASPDVLCVTRFRGDGLNASAGRCYSSIADHRAALRRCVGLADFTGTLVVNADDPGATRLGADHPGQLLTYGESTAADLGVEPLENHPSEQVLLVTHEADSVVLTLRVAGSAARRDAVAALATAIALTGDLATAARSLELAGPVAERLDPVSFGQDFGLWLDAAVRPLELAEAIDGASVGDGRLLAIFRLAEDPAAAQEQIELAAKTTDRAFAHGAAHGLVAPSSVSLVEDELAALAVGIGLADSGDRVLVAGGRGQDNRELVEALLERRLACEPTSRAA